MAYAEEIKTLTGDAGARRLGEIVDALTARLNQCCPEGDPVRPRDPPAPPSPAPGDANTPMPR